MRRLGAAVTIAVAVAVTVTIAAAAPLKAGVLRVRYEAAGGADILIRLDDAGAVIGVSGGADKVAGFSADGDAIEFDALVKAHRGGGLARFTLSRDGAGFTGRIRFHGDCMSRCEAPARAAWD